MVGGRVDSTSGNESAVGLSDTRSSQSAGDTIAIPTPTTTNLQFGGPNTTPLLDGDANRINNEDNSPVLPVREPNFRGMPVRLAADDTHASIPNDDDTDRRNGSRRHVRAPGDRFMDTPRTQTTHMTGRTTTSTATILRYGSESFEEYMQQFMSSEVRYKDFRKATFQRYDSGRQESFIQWYKLFCATCLQWGLWCPPYESVEEDNIHGQW
jgi:hypothetical protein